MRGLVVVLGAVGLIACSPVFSPPVRTAHGGAPGRLAARQMEANVEVNTYETGGPSLAYAIDDHFVVEGGVELADAWFMSFAGGKLQWTKVRRGVGVALEGELGGGLGVGGACDDEEQCADIPRPPAAYGGYGGLGLAVRVQWFTLFGRFRAQVTDADGLPTTTWLSGLVGFQLGMGPVFLHVAGGFGSYSNAVSDANGFLADLGLAVRWDT